MKKSIFITVFVLTLAVIAPMQPQVHAASVADTILTQVISQSQSATTVQKLARIKQDLDQGNKEDLLGMLTQSAIDRVGDSNMASVATNLAHGGKLGDVVQTAVSQAAEQKLNDKLGKYRESLTSLATLLKNSNLYPKISRDSNSVKPSPGSYGSVLAMAATAYAPGVEDNGQWNNLTYTGGTVHKGVVAVDPDVIPLGTNLWVEGYGRAVAEDEGGAIKGNRIDLAFNNRQEALDYGIKPVKVYIMK